MLTDQLANRKTVQMKKNDKNCCLTCLKYLNLDLFTVKELNNAKKVGPTDEPTDGPTDGPTDTVNYRVQCSKD